MCKEKSIDDEAVKEGGAWQHTAVDSEGLRHGVSSPGHSEQATALNFRGLCFSDGDACADWEGAGRRGRCKVRASTGDVAGGRQGL